ncbi:hypothetical protein GQ600_8570 [Phytophthora cactorum]|nr:hypothetical protein GQ600_8570 [Phytophthora cactorum]
MKKTPACVAVKVGIRRATPTRIAEAAEAINSYLAERQDVRVGDIARTHWAISQAASPTMQVLLYRRVRLFDKCNIWMQ